MSKCPKNTLTYFLILSFNLFFALHKYTTLLNKDDGKIEKLFHHCIIIPIWFIQMCLLWCLCGLNGSLLEHTSLPPEFESRHWHNWGVFHIWPCFITFGGCLAHLAYHVHKSGHKTSVTTIIIIIFIKCVYYNFTNQFSFFLFYTITRDHLYYFSWL